MIKEETFTYTDTDGKTCTIPKIKNPFEEALKTGKGLRKLVLEEEYTHELPKLP
ncbi:hypothetical protein FACS189418_1590 [Clostridia bacterium]|nr:hypothetical protein FACS189418_1590 [Clostridia bacterium]